MCHYLCNSTISGKPEGPEEDQCHWNGLLSDNQKIFLSDVNRHAGAVTILMSMTVTILILSSKELSNDRYYRNLLNYSISASARAVVALVTYVNMAYSCGSYNYWDMSSCEILATVDTFLSVYEFESLTQLCIATFISAFYTVKEWEIPAWHNGLFTAISVVLGALYSAMPFLGIGRFKKDFDCIQCTYDVIMPQRKRLQVAITAIFLLKHVKPVVFMFGALWFARRLEVRETLLRTKGLLYAVIATVTFSLPIFLVRASVLAKQLFNNVTPESNDIGCYVGWAIFFNMIATPLAFIFLYAGDKRLSDYLGKITCRRVVIVKVVRVCTCTCVPAPASPAPGSPAPGSPAPGLPAPASPAPGSPAPGSPAPASPAPAPPAPASPAQLEQE